MNIEETKLDSGLRVFANHFDAIETVTIGLWLNAGARHENRHNNGIAHFLEHMAFKGTKTRNARQIAEEIESVGGFMNAWTAREQTAYYVRVPADEADIALDILADILVNPTFEREEMERERGVILQEIGRNHDTPDDLVFDFFQETAFPDQSLGRPILGSTDSVSQMTRDHLTDYLNVHYSAPHAVLACSGQMTLGRLEKLAEQKFGSFALNPTPEPFSPGHYQGGKIYKTRKDIEQSHIVLGFPAPHYHHQDYYKAKVFSSLMGQGMASKLFQEIREKRGLAYSIFSFTLSMSDHGLFGIYAGTGSDSVEKLIEGLSQCLETATKEISENELKRAKKLIRSGMMMSMESSAARAEQLARHVLIFGKPLSLKEQIKQINAVTEKDLCSFAETLIKSPATLAAIGPDSQKAQNPAEIAERYFSFPHPT